MEQEPPSTQQISFVGKQAALLSVVEVGLGSVLHGLKIPLSGQFLSCNQGFLLCRAVRNAKASEQSRFLGATISNVAALLKSLSPAGKKLTPMLAISSQGLLFSVGTAIFGANYLGCLLGVSLLSVWAFAQPLLIAYFLFGSRLLQAVEKLFVQISKALPFVNWQNFLLVVISLVILKIIICLALCTFAFFGGEKVNRYFEKLEEIGRNHQQAKRKKRNFFLQPLFLLSLGITFFFFYFSGATNAELAWIVMRPLALGVLIYFIALHLPLEKWATRLQSTKYSRFGNALGFATAYLKRNSPKSSLRSHQQ